MGGIIGTTVGLFRERQAKLREAAQLAIAIEQREKAEKARDRTRDVLDAMTSEATGDSLATQKAISEEQKKFLTEVLIYYQEFAGEKADDERARARIAQAAHKVGLIQYRVGNRPESVKAFQMACDGYAALASDFTAVPGYRQLLARNHINLGQLLKDFANSVAAEGEDRKALVILEKLAAEFPTVPAHRQDLARVHRALGNVLGLLGKTLEAEREDARRFSSLRNSPQRFPPNPRIA